MNNQGLKNLIESIGLLSEWLFIMMQSLMRSGFDKSTAIEIATTLIAKMLMSGNDLGKDAENDTD